MFVFETVSGIPDWLCTFYVVETAPEFLIFLPLPEHLCAPPYPASGVFCLVFVRDRVSLYNPALSQIHRDPPVCLHFQSLFWFLKTVGLLCVT